MVQLAKSFRFAHESFNRVGHRRLYVVFEDFDGYGLARLFIGRTENRPHAPCAQHFTHLITLTE
jgi:hypothetical protein